MTNLVLFPTPARTCWVSLPPPLCNQLFDTFQALPLVLQLSPLDPLTGDRPRRKTRAFTRLTLVLVCRALGAGLRLFLLDTPSALAPVGALSKAALPASCVRRGFALSPPT